MTGNDWQHYEDLPYEVVIETVDEKGNVTHRELGQRHSLLDEAMRTRSKFARSVNNPLTHRVVLDDVKAKVRE